MAIKNPQKCMDSAKRRRRQTKQLHKEAMRERRRKIEEQREALRAKAAK